MRPECTISRNKITTWTVASNVKRFIDFLFFTFFWTPYLGVPSKDSLTRGCQDYTDYVIYGTKISVWIWCCQGKIRRPNLVPLIRPVYRSLYLYPSPRSWGGIHVVTFLIFILLCSAGGVQIEGFDNILQSNSGIYSLESLRSAHFKYHRILFDLGNPSFLSFSAMHWKFNCFSYIYMQLSCTLFCNSWS